MSRNNDKDEVVPGIYDSEEDVPGRSREDEEDSPPPVVPRSNKQGKNQPSTIRQVLDGFDSEEVGEEEDYEYNARLGAHKKGQGNWASLKSFMDENDLKDDLDANPFLLQDDEDEEILLAVEEPTPAIIKKFVTRKHVRKSNGKKLSFFRTRVSPTLFRKTAVTRTELIKLGPGVMSYFFFLKLYAFAFFLFSLVTAPVMYFNYIASTQLDSYMRLSVGNLFQSDDLLQEEVDTFFEVEFQGQNITLDRDQISYVQVGSSIIVIIMFLSIAEYSVQVFKRQQYEWEKKHPTLESFTVEVTNLPPKVKYKEIEQHFEDFARKRVVNSSHRLKDAEDVEGGDQIKGENVHDVQLITTTKARLTFAIKVADLARIAEHKAAKYALAQRKLKAGKMSKARHQLILVDYKNAVKKLDKYWENDKKVRRLSERETAIKAFVTFKSLDVREAILEEYNRKIRLERFCGRKDEDLYLENKKLKVVPAVSPELLKWENVDYKKGSRRSRGCVSCLIILLILLISSISIFAATKVENADLFNVFNDTQREAVEEIDSCQQFELDQRQLLGNETENEDLNLLQVVGCENEQLIEDLSNDCAIAVNCFCTVRDIDVNNEAVGTEICRDFIFDSLVDTALFFGTGLLVALFNFILEVMISGSVKFEKDIDRRKEERKLFTRLFVATYINTALVKLVADLSLEQVFGLDFANLNFLANEDGQFNDFTFDWYAQVGPDLLFISVTNIFGPHFYSFFGYFYYHLKLCCFKPISLQDIKRRYLGPEFLVPLRYAQALVVIYFTLTYSPGIPILYPIGGIALLVSFFVDKFLLLKFYREPPLYTNDIVLWICKGMKVGIILHNIFAIAMLSEPGLFPLSSGNFDAVSTISDAQDFNNVSETLAGFERLTGTPVVFLTVLLMLIILYQILAQFEVMFRLFVKIFAKLFTCFFGCLFYILTCRFCVGKTDDERQNRMLSNFKILEKLERERRQRQLKPDLLIGLASYNILANPLYARKFKLKNGSFDSMNLNSKLDIHTTAEVLPLLANGNQHEDAKRIFEKIVEKPKFSLVRAATRQAAKITRTGTMASAGSKAKSTAKSRGKNKKMRKRQKSSPASSQAEEIDINTTLPRQVVNARGQSSLSRAGGASTMPKKVNERGQSTFSGAAEASTLPRDQDKKTTMSRTTPFEEEGEVDENETNDFDKIDF